MQRISYTKEKFAIKSFVWTHENILVYSTKSHIKYMLPNGDTGILKCVSNFSYLLKISGESVSSLGLNGEVTFGELNFEEAKFKNALYKKDVGQVKSFLKFLKFSKNQFSFLTWTLAQLLPLQEELLWNCPAAGWRQKGEIFTCY